MITIVVERASPPYMVEARRPQRSESRKAGMEVTKIRTAEMPDAKNEALDEDRPACWKRRGAYFHKHVSSVRGQID